MRSLSDCVSPLPIRYKTLAYRRYEVATLDRLIARIRRDLVVFISDNLDCFQSCETRTDHKVFGNVAEFKKGYLRHLRKKLLP